MRHLPQIRPRETSSQQDDRGAALVEFTFVAGLLFMIVFGTIEFGLAFRDQLTVANATQGAARVGSGLGADLESDYQILASLEQSLANVDRDGIENVRFVDIYLVGPDGEPAGKCVAGGGGTLCNRYEYVPDPDQPCDWDPCPNPDQGYGDWVWAPYDRDVALPGLDVLGVRMIYGHEWVTSGLVPLPQITCNGTPNSRCWSNAATMRLEPQIYAE